MCAARMHADEADVDASPVGRLLGRQFPRWAGLPVERLPSSGTENAMSRLGTDPVARLPRRPGAVAGVAHEQRRLPRLGPRLPAATPEPVGAGEPDREFPWPWSVHRRPDGRNPAAGAPGEPERLAADLAAYVAALRRIDPADAPAGPRGGPLAAQDAPAREALAQLRGQVGTGTPTALWERAPRTPGHAGRPVRAHGGLSPGNVLADGGRPAAVIDFGCAGVGDPAVDPIAARNLLPAGARGVFREAVGADEAQGARARGWALSISLIRLPYHRDTDPQLAGNSRHVLREILAGAG
ncbi:hypothetical protein SUDANB6_05459 [Streptomyces sp. enrichment culture]